MKKRQWWMLGIGAALVIGLISSYPFWKKNEAPVQAQAATVQVRRGNLEVLVSGKGSVAPTDQKTVVSDVTGTVKSVLEEGDRVKKGDVIIELEGQDLTDKITAQQVALQKQQLDMKDLEKKIKSTADEDSRSSLLLSFQKQQLDIQTTRNQIAELEQQQHPDPIVSPIDGAIVSISVNPGDDLNTKKEVAKVANYDVLQMVASVDELDIPKVQVGQKVRISVDALSDQAFTGEVTKIANEGSPTNGVASFDVTIKMDEAKGVKAGMSAEASIEVQKKDGVLYLPIDAVQSFQNQFFVMVPETAAGNDKPSGSVQPSPSDSAQASPSGSVQASPNGSGERAATGRSGAEGRRGAAGGDAAAVRGGRQMTAAGSGGIGGSRKQVEVGIHNEDYIEIVSGLNEGDFVILPVAVSSTSSNGFQMRTGGAFPAGGGGFPAGRTFTTGGGGGGGNFRVGGR